jgi:hypothetical protein
LPHIHPESWNTGNVGAVRIGVQTKHIGVEGASFLDLFWRSANANSVMMQLDDFNGHTIPSLWVEFMLNVFAIAQDNWAGEGSSAEACPLGISVVEPDLGIRDRE